MSLESTLAPQSRQPGFWREIWQQLRLVYYLIRDPQVPFYLKFLPFSAVLYALFPFDLLPDLAPVIGQLDDITALLVGAKIFIELAPPEIVARHMQKIQEQDGFLDAVSDDSENDLNKAIIIDADHEVIVNKEKDQE